MKNIKSSVCLSLWIMGAIVCIHLAGSSAWAGDGSKHWRSTYDLVMAWVNFAILVFLLVKYLKTPLMNFLYGQREDVAREIRQMEREKEKVSGKIGEMMKALADSETHFAELKNRFIKRGEDAKQNIIKDAEQQSRLIMDLAKQKITGRIAQAKSEVKVQLVDEAIALATKKLPEIITDDDNQKLLDRYLIAAT
jgi:F-type H+-transporting ATPase subunit b